MTGTTCGAGNTHSFRYTGFHTLWGVHDFTHSLYIHYRICQSKDYVCGLMTLVCLPGLVLTAVSWTYIILPPSRQWIICNNAIPSQKGTHIWCTELKFPDLSSRGLQSGLHEHPSFFVWSLRVDYILYQINY